MSLAQRFAQFSVALAGLLPFTAAAQTPSLDKDDGKNHIFRHKNMEVVLMRDAQFGFTTEPQDSATHSEVRASGVLYHAGGQPVGGQKNGKQVQKNLVDPLEPQFKNTNFGTNNWVFHKNGITGDFDVEPYSPSMPSISQTPGSVGQSGLMGLNNGVNVANKASQNRNERIGLFGKNRDLLIVKCDNCTVYEMAQLALELGADEGGMLEGGKGMTGFTANTGDQLVTKGQAQSKSKLSVHSDLNTWVIH
jgi:hypothetical protein